MTALKPCAPHANTLTTLRSLSLMSTKKPLSTAGSMDTTTPSNTVQLTPSATNEAEELTTYNALKEKCNRTRLVVPNGLKRQSLVVVGEALGADEELQGEYFVGKAGGLLDKLLKEVGLIRSSLHITNVVKVRPPDNKLDRLGELGLSIEDFLPYLKEELEAIQPKAILALGQTALDYLTSERGVTKWRGSVLQCSLTDNAYTVVPTLHPSYLQRGQMHLYPYVRHDIKTFAEIGFGIYRPPTPYESIIDPTLQQAVDYLQTILSEATETCYDIETVAHQRITCIGWTLNANSGICIPFRHHGLKNRWTEAEHLMLLDLMRQLFARPGLTKIAQNAPYDNYYLAPLIGYPREPLFDTRYAHELIHADARHDLGFLTSVYTDMNYHKDEAKDWASGHLPHDQTLWTYNVKDIISTHRVAHGLMHDLRETGQWDFFTGFVMPFRRVLFDMEFNGINVDRDLMTEWRRFIRDEELPVANDILKRMAGRDLNPNSSKQIGEFLATDLKLPVPRTAAGNYTVKDEVLKDLRARFPQHRDLINQILCIRVLKSKDLGTYLTAPLAPDGRMYCSYGSTITGRLSSSANPKGYGTNNQNIPKRLRQILIPEPGQVFIDPDLSQAEARVMAWLMQSESLKDVFRQGKKIHKEVGSWLYEKSPDDLTPLEYLTAKRTVHGNNYALGIRKFARIIERPVNEARVLQEKYYSVVPELSAYHRWVDQQITENRELTTPYGRKRVFTGRLDQETFRSGYAQIPQSTVVDTVNMGILGLWLIKPPNIHLVTQTHDSVLVSLPPNDVEWFSRLVVMHMETLRTLTIHDDQLTIPVDVGPTKTNWYGK